MLATGILFLREGLEASLLISMLFSLLHKVGEQRKVRAVWFGVVLALLCSAVGAILISITIHTYVDSTFQTIFETITYILAVAILTFMTFWMQKHSPSLKSELLTKVQQSGSGFALGVLAFTTVGREGLETAVFTLALAFHGSALALFVSAAIGLLVSLGISWAVYVLGYHLNYRLFFRSLGLLLLLFAAAFVGDAVQNMQTLGWLPMGTHVLWQTGHWLSENSTLGDILHTFIGYSEAPTLLQATLYSLYLLIAGGYFAYITRISRARTIPTPVA